MLKLLSSNLFLSRRVIEKIGFSAIRSTSNGQEIVEGIVCKESDIPEDGMKEFEFGPDGKKVLLVKQNGTLFGIGTKCSHYGVPLVKGALGKGRVRCPAHGACFNLKTGDIEDNPGLDGVPCFDVKVLPNGDVKVCAAKSTLSSEKKVKPMVRKNPKVQETYVIIGGGAAGESCAEVLRQEGFTGRIVVLAEEKFLPYDRVKCNKNMNFQVEDILLRTQDFYNSNDIEMLTGEKVTKLDTSNKLVVTESGKEFPYKKVFIAVGVRARKPTSIPNHELENIFTIRKIDDGNTVNSKLQPLSRVVVIGSSFIGMESAAYCAPKVGRVTVLGRTDVPFLDSLGREFGQRIVELFETHGVHIRNNVYAVKFEGSDNKLTGVVLNTGETIPAEICIVGIGSEYDTKFLSETDIKLTKQGAIEVNEFLETNVEGVFAGGDVAYAPVYGTDNINASIGHWQLAQHHGRIAAKNMVGKQVPIKGVPFFFSTMFGLGVRYSGYGHGFTEALTVGKLDQLKFVTYYLKDDQVIAAGSIGADPIVSQVAEMLQNGLKLTRDDVVDSKWLLKYKIA